LERNTTFAVGHLSLGYIFAKGTAKLLQRDINLPLIFLLSLIPDVDIVIRGIEHRTITHSIIMSTIAFLPIFAVYSARATPYLVALAQHSMVGDFITGGVLGRGAMLLWPLSTTWYGLPIGIGSQTNIIIEWTSFLLAMAIMIKSKDLQKMLKGTALGLVLTLPILAVLLPSFAGFPLAVPYGLLVPHLVYLVLFAFSVLNVLRAALAPLRGLRFKAQ
jgi:membrane-bound metal-dependent hydrolase YbcI (DUF457 family)